MMFETGATYENSNPNTTCYIKVVKVIANNSLNSNLIVSYYTKIADTLIATEEIIIQAKDYGNWRLRK